MCSEVIAFENVYKVYSKYMGLQKVKNFLDRLKNGQIGKKLITEVDYYALNGISFSIEEGETVGLIGPNGAGKSTILKIINKIAYPTRGKVRVRGTIGGLLELGAGFEPDLPGRDNVFINAAIFGFSKKQTAEIFDEILDISELHHYIDVPIKKYSSGMKVRLGFAVAMATNPDVVLLDEVLAVGDAKFRQKSMKMMKEYISDKTVVFVSHSMDQIQEVCDRVMVMDHGDILYDGDTEDAISYYHELNEQKKQAKSKKTVVSRGVKRGFAEAHKAEVDSVTLYTYDLQEIREAQKGERAIIDCRVKILEKLGDLYVKIMVKKLMMQKFSETMDEFNIVIPEEKITGDFKDVRVSFSTGNLKPGSYTIEIVPQFERQSLKSAISVYSHPLVVVSEEKEEQIGLIDLEFEVESAGL